MNPRITTEKIKEDYKNYIASILTVRDEEISHLAKEEVKRTSFTKQPFHSKMEKHLRNLQKREQLVKSFLKWEKIFIITIGNCVFIRKKL